MECRILWSREVDDGEDGHQIARSIWDGGMEKNDRISAEQRAQNVTEWRVCQWTCNLQNA